MKKHIRLISEIYTLRTITGGEGQDTVNAGGGDDTIVLGTQAADGTDDIIGGAGDDTIQIATGQSFVFSTSNDKLQSVENVQLGAGASVTLTGQQENFTVIGGGGAETIITSSGDDTVNAGLGDDFIQAAAGADVINGGAGSDTVSYADVTATTSHGLGNVTGMAVNFTGTAITDAAITTAMGGTIVVGNDDQNDELAAGTVQYLVTADANKTANHSVDTLTGVEGFVGSALADYIALGADAVTVDAGDGADVIFSGTASDNITAGAGNDVINIAASSDHSSDEIITGGAGTDTIRFNSVLNETLVLSANVTGVETVAIAGVNGGAGGATAENIDASALTAGITINGNDGDNRITGSAFADTLDGNDGNDTYIVSTGDTVTEADGEGDDVIVVNANVSFTAAALEGVETATLASGTSLTVDHTDVLGTDNLRTVTGVAGGDAETLIVTGAALGVTATKDFATGNITLTNVSLDYRGGIGVDNVTGTSAADLISGGFGDDVLSGGTSGADTLTGGDGSDTFNVSANDSKTTITEITDFEIGDNDTLRIVDTTLSTATRANLFEAVTLSSGDTIESVQVSAGGVVSLFDENVALAGTQQLFAITEADVVNITEALLLNVGNAGSYLFGLDANADDTAESTIVVSTTLADGGVTNIVQLTGVAASGTTLGTTATADQITIAAGDVTYGTAANDTLTGDAEDNTIFGLAGNDTIDGAAGADTLNGDIGDDSLTGGAGDDTFNVTAGTDTITDLATGDILVVSGGATATANDVAAFVATAGTTNAGTATLNAEAGGSTITMTLATGDFALVGGAGVDNLTGGGGDDTITGGADADALTGGAGDDIYIYTGTADVAAAETITEAANGGTDRIQVDGTTDFSAITDADSFNEIEELDITGAFTATFTGAQLTGETMSLIGDTGGAQALVVTATAAGTTDLSNISAGTDWTAGTDTVTINGGAGAETITGTQTNDIIVGGAGADELTGGDGNDTFTLANVANVKATADNIRDFTSTDNIAIQATGAGEFGDLHDSDGDAFDGAATGVVSTVNIADGAADLATADANVIAINADTTDLSIGYATIGDLQTAVAGAAITEVGGGTFADGDELVIAWLNTTDNAYEVGIITIAGADGFDGGNETYEKLLEVDVVGTLTLAEVAASIDFIA